MVVQRLVREHPVARGNRHTRQTRRYRAGGIVHHDLFGDADVGGRRRAAAIERIRAGKLLGIEQAVSRGRSVSVARTTHGGGLGGAASTAATASSVAAGLKASVHVSSETEVAVGHTVGGA